MSEIIIPIPEIIINWNIILLLIIGFFLVYLFIAGIVIACILIDPMTDNHLTDSPLWVRFSFYLACIEYIIILLLLLFVLLISIGAIVLVL